MKGDVGEWRFGRWLRVQRRWRLYGCKVVKKRRKTTNSRLGFFDSFLFYFFCFS